jgi:hypothetical protein
LQATPRGWSLNGKRAYSLDSRDLDEGAARRQAAVRAWISLARRRFA